MVKNREGYSYRNVNKHRTVLCWFWRFYAWLVVVSVISVIILYGQHHYNDVIMGAIASQITSPTIVYSIVYSDADQRKHQSSASLAFARGIHRGPVNFPHKWPVTRKMFPFDDVIMTYPHVFIETWGLTKAFGADKTFVGPMFLVYVKNMDP